MSAPADGASPQQRATLAELYALTHRGSAGDSAFYERLCVGAASVLELGSGYGRLLTRLALGVPRVVGLERDRALQALAKKSLRALPAKRRRAVSLELADMRHFELSERFERVILPYNGLFCLLGKRDALACLRSVRAALTEDGLFACDVWNADGFHRQRPVSEPGAQPLCSLSYRDQQWFVTEQTHFLPRQGLRVRYDYLPERGALRTLTIQQRYFHSRELFALLGEAGFSVRSRRGDFDETRFTARSPRLVITATPARARSNA